MLRKSFEGLGLRRPII